jgi:hypothetical protein
MQCSEICLRQTAHRRRRPRGATGRALNAAVPERASRTLLSGAICRVPTSSPQRDLLKQFERSLTEGGARHSPQSKSRFDRVKSLFD